MKKTILLFFLLIVNVWVSHAQTPNITIDEFDFILGKWSGTLEYLDYGDDQTKTTLDTDVEYTRKGKKILVVYNYKEPNGKVITEKGKIRVKNVNKITFGKDKYWLKKQNKNDKREKNKLVLMRLGRDNNQPCTIRRTVVVKGDQLRIKKDIKLEGKRKYFMRNELLLERVR